MQFVEHFIEKCLEHPLISAYCAHTFEDLRAKAEEARNIARPWLMPLRMRDGRAFTYYFFREQAPNLEYVTKDNDRAFVISWKFEERQFTLFFNHYHKAFAVVPDKVCKDEGFLGGSRLDVNFLVDRTGHYFLYSDHGKYLGIEGEKVWGTRDLLRGNYYKHFIIAESHGKFTVYSEKLEPLITEADHFKCIKGTFVEGTKGIATKNGKKYVYHCSKGAYLDFGVDGVAYVKDKYAPHNGCEFLVLCINDKYALYSIANRALWNAFEWDEYRYQLRKEFMYYRIGQQWYRLHFESLKSELAKEVEF